ncbi:hypothetical protein BDZ89DRAFT_1119045 [Hymenopellis radicata]|nr:hypothetical protein BDZ89DRAFT_1119045 [Hymenopellis radicata]
MSSHNPFRDPIKPQLTTSTSASPSTSTTPPAAPQPAPSPKPSNSPSHTPIEPDPTGLSEELPPAYTPGPNVYQGESTVEYGPRRPFQSPPPRPQPPQQQPQVLHPQPTGWSTLQTPYYTGDRQPSLLRQITDHIVDQINNGGSSSSSSSYNRYNAPQTGYSGYPGQSVRPQSTGSHLLIPQNTGVPPPLPPRPASGYASPSASSPESAHESGASSPAEPSDSRPTTRPVPGHPLLNAGRLLVYPAGYECYKCHNIGYKQNDPSHPCRKCWQKYAKPFTGALTYSSFEAGAPGRDTLQRPLPVLPPPQFNRLSPQPPWQQRGPTITPVNGYPRGQQNSVVYSPGDPRIGGRLCWRCDGRGLVSLLFLEDSCPVCGGIGRLFR